MNKETNKKGNFPEMLACKWNRNGSMIAKEWEGETWVAGGGGGKAFSGDFALTCAC